MPRRRENLIQLLQRQTEDGIILVDPTSEGVGPRWQMQPLGELARVRADEPPTPPTERLSAGRQLNAIFALALLAAPSVRGCPMKADIAIFLSEARFKANGGDFFTGADD